MMENTPLLYTCMNSGKMIACVCIRAYTTVFVF